MALNVVKNRLYDFLQLEAFKIILQGLTAIEKPLRSRQQASKHCRWTLNGLPKAFEDRLKVLERLLKGLRNAKAFEKAFEMLLKGPFKDLSKAVKMFFKRIVKGL